MQSSGTPHAVLDAWREQGADRIDLIAFHYMVALHRRAAGHGGDTRRVLENRLSALIQAYADGLERAETREANRARTPETPALGMLRELVGELTSRTASVDGANAAAEAAPSAAFPEMPALDDFRKIWTRVRSDSQMRRSREPSPTEAGPLNSSRLVHRALTLMRELSPGYLQQFLSYIDALSWLQQTCDSGALGSKETSRHDSGKARPGRAPRKRRG
jgi:hypothetical protein